MPWEYCTVKDAVMGFFTGTETDPDVANSRCVTYFPILQDQLEYVVNSIDANIVIPTHTVAWINQVVALINRYALWQNYCVFATLFTRLDNTVSTREGLITAASRGLFNSQIIQNQMAVLQEAHTNGQCFNAFRAAGTIFGVILDFNVPEDIV